MRFVMAAVTFVLAVVLLPCQGLPAAKHYVRNKTVSVQGAKKPARK